MWFVKILALVIFITLSIIPNLAAPADDSHSLVVSSTEASDGNKIKKEGYLNDIDLTTPNIYQMRVNSDISNRFAHTTVISKVKNFASEAQETTFSVVLPENAFISGFIMEVAGKNYTAYIKEKEEAKKTYDQAVTSGLGAAHVAVSARDSNRFTVSVNVEPESKAAFYLSYEELLKREDGHYELVINLHPGQPIKDLSVQVNIAESRKIVKLKTPPIRSGNEIGTNNDELDPRATVETVNDTAAVITFSPNIERQKQLAHLLGTKLEAGLAGQFVVQYDVERDPQGGEVLVKDGYFVHFFAPTELAPLSKHVVFVLDTSSSMYNQKIEQLKQAMHRILEQLNEIDIFHIVEFNSIAKVWDLNNPSASVQYPNDPMYGGGSSPEEPPLESREFPAAYTVNADNIKKAKNIVSAFTPTGSTDIYSALKTGLHLVDVTRSHDSDLSNHQPLIVFLTDGDPTVGVTSIERIVNEITNYNGGLRQSPIFALSFGSGADKKFLQKLALRNSGFSKHIYEAADASLQLQDFYRQISSPLLANVTFNYIDSASNLTKTQFPIHFRNSELVVAGCEYPIVERPGVSAWNGKLVAVFQPTVQESASSIERLWAYLTIKQLLERKEASDADQEESKQKALSLALKYSFVTPLTSLVVVKPNATNAVNTEAADEKPQGGGVRRQMSISRSSGGPRYDNFIRFGGGGSRSFSSSHTSSYPIHTASLPTIYRRPTHSGSYHRNTHGLNAPLSIHSATTAGVFSTTPKTPNLFSVLPWLKNIVNQNGTINLPIGNYRLGLNERLTDIVVCAKTPLNTAGHCSLLDSCPQVHSLLTNVDVLMQHFCVLQNEYAGVCCPSTS